MVSLCNLNTGVAVLLLVGCVLGDNNYNGNAREHHNSRVRPGGFCEDLSPQNFIEMDHIMGLWYGAEVITHQDGVYREQIYDTCVIVHMAEITDEVASSEQYRPRDNSRGYHGGSTTNHQYDQQRFLRLTWDEKGANFEYMLRFNDSNSGFWKSSSPHQISATERYYTPFTGTVQVMKAVGNHVVLTFCEAAPKNQLFTIILARQRNELSRSDLQSVHKLLSYRQMPINNVRKVCLTGGAASLYSSKTGVMLLLVSLVCVVRSLVGSKQE